MKQIRLIMAAAVVGAAALLLFGGWRMSRNFAAAREALRAREAAYAKVVRIYEKQPFPGTGSTAVVRSDTDALRLMLSNIAGRVSLGQVETENLSPSLSVLAMQGSVRRMLADAPIMEGARVVPDSFLFGFDRYLTPGATVMPSLDDVPRLAQQLAMVERLVAQVYAARIVQLRTVKRPEFEAAAASPDAGSRYAPAAPAAAGPTGRPDLYTSQHFTLEVSCRKPALIELMNRLAAMDMFVVVTELAVRKRADDLKVPPPPATVAAPAEAAAPGATLLPGAAVPGGAAAASAPQQVIADTPASARLVSGPEIDPLLDVRIELDVYNFKIQGV